MRNFLAAASALLIAVVASSASGQQQYNITACTKNYSGAIQPAPAGANPELAAYLGVWTGGRWDSKVCNALIVSEVRTNGTAKVQYIFDPTRDVPAGNFVKDDAVIKGGQLYFKSLLGADVWYKLQPDGTLYAEFHPNNTPGKFKMVDRPRKQ